MKKIFLVFAACCALAVSCEKYDDSEVKDAIAELNKKVTALQNLDKEISALKDMINGNVSITSYSEKNGSQILVLSNGKTISIPSTINDIPIVTIVEVLGKKCWAYYQNGKTYPFKIDGVNVPVTGPTPQLRVNDFGYVEVSVDGGKTWVETEAKLSAGGIFSSVEKGDDSVVLTLADGVTQIVVPLLQENEILFMSMCGPQYFTAGQTLEIPVEMVGIEEYTVTEKPDGWKATLKANTLVVTAPSENAGETSGYIKMLGVGAETKIAKIFVSMGEIPCQIMIDDAWQATILPTSMSWFYGVSLLEEFDAKTIISELAGVTPAMSRKPYTSVEVTFALSDQLDIVEGNTYVVWALPVKETAYSETDMLYQAVTSIGVESTVENVTYGNAAITVRAKGADAYYLVPLGETLTLDGVVSDLQGSFAATYDRYKHDAVYRGTLTDLVSNPIAGNSYDFLVLPIKSGKFLQGEAEQFTVKLNPITFGGNSVVSLTKGDVNYKSISAQVIAGGGAYKVFTATVSASDYTLNNYADDTALLTYLSGLTATPYTEEYTYTANNLESGSQYWMVAAAMDRQGVIGTPVRLQVSTRAIEYSNVKLTLAEPVLTLQSAQLGVSASGEIATYRYFMLSSDGGAYWYSVFVDDDTAAFNALVFGTVEYTEVTSSQIASGIFFDKLIFGTNYIFRIIGLDKDGKITNLGKVDFTPTVGKVVKFSDERWAAAKPEVTHTLSGTSIRLNVTFPKEFKSFVVARVSSEEYDAYMPGSARERADYVVSHMTAMTFDANLQNYKPDWYISADKPYILITWEDENGWYDPLVYNSKDGSILNK